MGRFRQCRSETLPQQLAFGFLAEIRACRPDVTKACAPNHRSSDPVAASSPPESPCFKEVLQQASAQENAIRVASGSPGGDLFSGAVDCLKQPICAAIGDPDFFARRDAAVIRIARCSAPLQPTRGPP